MECHYGISKNDLQCYCAHLAREYPFASCLNSQARQAAADRAWFAISRFYENCKQHKRGKKGYPKFQHDNRSVEYKTTGWKLEDNGKHITFTDGCSIGRVRLIGTRDIETFTLHKIKRVRIIKRADGYSCQFAVQAERKRSSRDCIVTIPVIAVPPQWTSQNCSGCGTVVKKTLSIRTHVCPACGLVLDRDHNAALNILQKAINRTVGHTATGLSEDRRTLLDIGPLHNGSNGVEQAG